MARARATASLPELIGQSVSLLLRIAVSGILLFAGSSALAAESHALKLEEIVVTAQKRETNLQSTPIAVSVLGSDALTDRDIQTLESLAYAVPGLVHAEAAGNAQVTLRGMGMDIPNIAGEPGVAVYVDGVYIKSLTQVTAAYSELERIEVLRGPQGSLYGRNAVGGAINIITRPADREFRLDSFAKYGNEGRFAAKVGVGGPISSSVAGRVSYEQEQHDGYTKDLADGQDLHDMDRRSVRGTLDIAPAPWMEVILRADYQEDTFTGIPDQPLPGGATDQALGLDPTLDDDVVQILSTGGRATLDPRTVFHDFDDYFYREIYGVSAEAGFDFPAFSVKSITAYRRDESRATADSDGTDVVGLHLVNAGDNRQFSQELQLLSALEGPFNYTIGVYYLDAEDHLSIDADFGLRFLSESDQETRSLAVFGEGYVQISERLRATLGARWTEDEKRYVTLNNFNPAGARGKRTFREFTPKVGLDYRFSDALFGYLTVSKGFKAGGFDIFGTGEAFEPEEVWAYEIGLKSEWLDDLLRVNVAAFYNDYEGLQVTQFPGDGTQLIDNAASAEIAGVELEASIVVSEWLELDTAVSILDSEFKKFVTADVLDPAGPLVDLSGNELMRAPPLSAIAGATLTLPVGSTMQSMLRIETSYVDDYFFTAFNRVPARQESYSMINAFLGVSGNDGSWQLSLYGRNLGDEDVLASAFESPAVGGYLAPRTYGAMVHFTFQ